MLISSWGYFSYCRLVLSWNLNILHNPITTFLLCSSDVISGAQNCVTNFRLVPDGAVFTGQPVDPFAPLYLGNLPSFEEHLRRTLLEVVRKDLSEQCGFRGPTAVVKPVSVRL